MKQALVLGAGLVAKPLIQYLLRFDHIHVTVASKDFMARDYIDEHPRGRTIEFDISDDAQLEDLVREADLVVSLLPYTFHVKVATLCIAHKTHMATASYVSDEMKSLHAKAEAAGIIILNEIGLDPGIDHMSAMELIDKIRDEGGKITSFESNCGGLPFWDAVTTPFQYKFSWSPTGVLLAAKNPAVFKQDGKIVHIPNKDLFRTTQELDLKQFGRYEVYPNRDSLKYIHTYGLEDVETLFRGTIRNLGWSDTFSAILDLNLLDQEREFDLTDKSYAQFMAMLLHVPVDVDIKEAVAAKIHHHPMTQTMNKLEWLGLFSDEIVGKVTTSFQLMLELISGKLRYAPEEKDMVILNHVIKYNLAQQQKEIRALLIAHGENGDNHIMSKTVGLPLAIASRLILEGAIDLRGVVIPIHKQIYQPVLKELREQGITFIEEELTHVL